MRISPPHDSLSVVTGIRIYTANNYPQYDPVQYRIEGRTAVTGANVRNRQNNECMVVVNYSDGYRVTTANCDSNDKDQQFYMNELGEIRVKSLPGYCMDPRYGLARGYKANYMVECNSDIFGPESYEASWHYFTYDVSTEMFESVLYPGYCVKYRTRDGWLNLDDCKNIPKFFFYSSDGSIQSDSSQDWALISEGNIPWISESSRNPLGVAIDGSTYEEGDPDTFFVGVKLYESTTPYHEYKISFPETRGSGSLALQFAEIELPGLILD